MKSPRQRRAKGGTAFVNTVTFEQALAETARRARKRAKRGPAKPRQPKEPEPVRAGAPKLPSFSIQKDQK